MDEGNELETKPAIAYLRVSKRDGRQTTENQRPEIERLAAARGFRVIREYEDHESAVKRRPGLEQMLQDLRRGRAGPAPIVLIWSLDRLGRGLGCFDIYRELARLNCRVISCKETWADQDGMTRDLLLMIMSWVSGWERERLISRTKAGLERARRMGRKIGRPRASLGAKELAQALVLRASGLGVRRIAEELGGTIGASTLHRLLAAHDALQGATACLETGERNRVAEPREIVEAA